MASQNQFQINGLIDTSKSVMENINTIATASSCWMTLDVNNGKWSPIINQAGSSVSSFGNSDILGAITVSGTGLTELYNRVEVSFPNSDVNDERDYVIYEIPQSQRFPNEVTNTLTLEFDCVNNSVQAGLLAARELKQSRLDKIIKFTTDYSKLGLKAGDLIDVTSTVYGFNAKMFRIITISEIDAPSGEIVLEITALEYDPSVYDTSGLVKVERTRTNGIKSKNVNQTIKNSDNKASLQMELSDIAKALGLILTFNNLTGKWSLSQGGKQVNIAGEHAIIAWTFEDGIDLDIRCRMYLPNLGQNAIDDYLGWTGNQSTSVWPPSGVPILIWGGDNTGTGQENVYVNITRLRELYPNQQYFVVECRANWYLGTNPQTYPGTKPVLLTANIYQGGTLSGPSNYTFTINGATKTRFVEGLSVYIDSNTGDPTTLGDLMGYFIFDAVNNVAQFRNDLTGIV